MELEKFARQLRLMVLLTQNTTLTIDEVGQKLNMSRRSIYRYLDAFKNLGFVIKKTGTKYRIDHSSPFFEKITSDIHFSEGEAMTISMALNSIYDNSASVRQLREKLAHLYNAEVLSRQGMEEKRAQRLYMIFRAIQEQRVVMFCNYVEEEGAEPANCIVEPYMFINENSEVRCYELSTSQNKTYKVDNIGEVKMVDLLWSHKSEHKPYHNDLFGFTGEQRKPVSLILGKTATNALLAEQIDAKRQLTPIDNDHFKLDTEVCSYVGIGRFVLGLYDDIEIVNSPDFATYIRCRISNMVEKAEQTQDA